VGNRIFPFHGHDLMLIRLLESSNNVGIIPLDIPTLNLDHKMGMI
jgi:hypothetical protein